MKVRLIAIAVATLLFVSSSHAGDQKTEALKAGGATVGGAALGGATFAAVGSVGVAVAGTAVAIGAAPFIAAGAVCGLAVYGVYRVVSDSSAPDSKPDVPAKPPQADKR
jgi:hypothetical protein